jgi:hypothetical protein
MSAGVSTCELCGDWLDASRGRKPGHCPRCLRIKEMFLAGVRLGKIGKRFSMTALEVHDVVRQLELKRGPGTCPVCGWQGRLDRHTPDICARKLLVRSLCEAGMPASEIARKLGVSRNLIFLTTQRLGIKCSPMRAEICAVCGWRGVISFHTPQRCAYLLRLREMRESGLRRREIVRELGISRAAVFQGLHRLGLSTKTPK